MVLEIGRLCVKTAGRDAMELCVVVEKIDKNTVLIDGNTRRKNVSIAHIEPLNKVLDVKSGADTKAVLAAFESNGIEVKKSVDKKAKVQKEQVKKADKSTVKKADKKKSAKKE